MGTVSKERNQQSGSQQELIGKTGHSRQKHEDATRLAFEVRGERRTIFVLLEQVADDHAAYIPHRMNRIELAWDYLLPS